MKFRTDFVTNSSSSSYVASFMVHTPDNTEIALNLSENKGNKHTEENADYSWEHSREHILKAIMKCATVSELTDLLVEECEKGLNWELLEDLKEHDPDDYDDRVSAITKKIKKFRKQMSKIKSLDELEAVILREEFYGWGEGANYNLEFFLRQLGGGSYDCYDKDVLKEKVGEKTADLLLRAVEEGCGDTNGFIDTTIKISDGSVYTAADMGICTSW